MIDNKKREELAKEIVDNCDYYPDWYSTLDKEQLELFHWIADFILQREKEIHNNAFKLGFDAGRLDVDHELLDKICVEARMDERRKTIQQVHGIIDTLGEYHE